MLLGFARGAGFSLLDTAQTIVEIDKSPDQFVNGIDALIRSPEARAQLVER